MTNCKTIQEKILTETPLNAEELKHVENCTDCSGMMQFLKRVDELPERPVPEALDRLILQSAHARRKHLRILHVAEWSLAAAAALAVCSWSILYEAPSKAVPEKKIAMENVREMISTQEFEDQLLVFATDVAGEMTDVSSALDFMM